MKKSKIVIIEFETHSALLEQWFMLLNAMENIDFHFLISKKIADKLTIIPIIRFTIIENDKDISTYISGYDLIIINTFHRNFDWYSTILQKKNTLCLLHNLNFSLFFNSINLKNIFTEKNYFYYYLKLYFLESIGSKRKLILKTNYLGVLSENLKVEILSNFPTLALKTKVLNLNFFKGTTTLPTKIINIVIPGNVSNKRKDFNMIFDLLPKLKPVNQLKFIFLGKPETDLILRKLKVLDSKCDHKVSIVFYSTFLKWDIYNDIISKSDLLLCPIKNKTSFYWVDEFYGKTKVSGSETDCIFNGKIGIFPSSYTKMNWHNLYYNNALTLEHILNTMSIEKLEIEYGNLQHYLLQYDFKKVKSQLENQLLNLV